MRVQKNLCCAWQLVFTFEIIEFQNHRQGQWLLPRRAPYLPSRRFSSTTSCGSLVMPNLCAHVLLLPLRCLSISTDLIFHINPKEFQVICSLIPSLLHEFTFPLSRNLSDAMSSLYPSLPLSISYNLNLFTNYIFELVQHLGHYLQTSVFLSPHMNTSTVHEYLHAQLQSHVQVLVPSHPASQYAIRALTTWMGGGWPWWDETRWGTIRRAVRRVFVRQAMNIGGSKIPPHVHDSGVVTVLHMSFSFMN